MSRVQLWTRRLRMRMVVLPLFGILANAAPAVRANVALCPDIQDNTLFQVDPSNPTIVNSNGIGPWFAAGRNRGGQLQRGLIQFDLSHIPTNATVTAASLSLYVTGVPNIETSNALGPRSFWLVALQGIGDPSWGEGASYAGTSGGGQGAPAQIGDATWLHKQYDALPWPVGREGALGPAALVDPGFLGPPAGTVPKITDPIPTPPIPVTWANSQMVLDVQAWVRGTIRNDGWVVVGEEAISDSSQSSKRQFASREGEAAYHPVLHVDYAPAAGSLTVVWNGGASGDDRWTTAANWGGTAPTADAILQFATPTAGGHVSSRNDFGAGTQFSGIVFPTDTVAYDLQGNRIKLAGPVENLSRNDQSIGLDIELVSAGEFDDRGKMLTLGGVLSGVSPVAKTGPGTLVLSGPNTYTGGTVVSGGTLRLTGSAASASGVTIAGGAKLDLAGTLGSSLAATTPMVNSGTLEVSSSLAQEVGAITGTGTTSVDASASLTADSIVQNTLAIGAGGSVTIRPTAGGANAHAVPEPGSWLLIGAGLLTWLAFRRRNLR